jgi:hypothetical protein
MTKITIEIDGSGVVHTQTPPSPGAQTVTTPTLLSEGNDGGSAPSADASYTGPVANAPSAAPSGPNPAFDPEGAVSAGPAPANLMGGVE